MYEAQIKGKISVVNYADLMKAASEGKPELFRNMDWMVLGPYVMKTEGAFETEYLYRRNIILEKDYLEPDGGETAIAPYLGLACGNPCLGEPNPVWKQGLNKWNSLRFDPDDGDSSCDEALFMTEQRNCIFYAAVYIRCEQEEDACIIYENSGCKLFLNGELVDYSPFGRVKGIESMGRFVPVHFRAGLNLLLFKLRPGYICDTVDLSMTNCAIWPAAAKAAGAMITYPGKTAAYINRNGVSCQVFPCLVAALADTENIIVSIGEQQVVEVGSLKAGESKIVRAEIPAVGGPAETNVEFIAGGESAESSFRVTTLGPCTFHGQELFNSSFHFDTTYHQEQRVYAMGAIYITREILKAMRNDETFKAVFSEVDYLHPYYSLYPADRDLMREIFTQGRAEADCFYNQPNEITSSAEGVVRNMLYGQLYHRDVLGRICDVYTPGDVFGHFNQMSQLCAKGGCGGVKWCKHIFGFSPAFRHISPDGTSLIHIRGGIGRGYAVENDISVCDYSSGMMTGVPGYSEADGMAWAKDSETHAAFSVPSQVHDILKADEKRITAENKPSPFDYTSRDMSCYHVGTLLTRTEIKQANRLAENLLISAEKFSAIAAVLGAKYPEKALDKAWRQLLCGQHHDSITGTNNEISFVDLMAEYREAVDLAADVLQRALGYIAGGVQTEEGGVKVAVFNQHLWDRSEYTTLRVTTPLAPDSYTLTAPDGKNVRFRVLSATEKPEGGYDAVIGFRAEVPSLGYAVYSLNQKPKLNLPAGLTLTEKAVIGTDNVIENEFYRLTVNPAKGGGIVSLVDKRSGRELIDLTNDGPANRLIAMKETHDRMEAQHEFYTTGHRLSGDRYNAKVVSEKASDSQSLTVTYWLGNITAVTQKIALYAGSDRIDFETRCDDYREEDDLFCVTFPLTLKGVRPVFDDRFAPQVRTESLNSMDFRTHQMMIFSHCGVFAANQWMDYGPSVTVKLDVFGKNTVNLGMSQIITAPGAVATGLVDRLTMALTKKAVPVTPFSDRKQDCSGSRIIHFNEDLQSETRFVLSQLGDGNLYAEQLLGSLTEAQQQKLNGKVADEGYAVVFLRDADNLWNRPIDVLLVLAKDETGLTAFIEKIEKDCAAGRFIRLDAIDTVKPGAADDYGVALLNTGNIACSVEKGGMLNMMLFHTAEFYGNVGRTNTGKKLVPERKSHIFKYALLPHAESYREAEVYRKAYAFNDPLLSFAVTEGGCGERPLPAACSFAKAEGPAVVTAFKAAGAPMASMKGEQQSIAERGLTLRCFEPDGVASKTRISTFFDTVAAYETNLLEEAGTELPGDGGGYVLNLTPHEIKTVKLLPVAEACNGSVIGAEREPVEPTYIRTWEHDLGSMAMGYLSLAGFISRNSTEPDELHIQTSISVANNYTDTAVAGEAKVQLPDGWQSTVNSLSYNLQPGECTEVPVVFTRPAAGAQGQIRLLYQHDGQSFCDVFEVGYFDPKFSVTWENGKLTATVENNTDGELKGELLMASPIETWGTCNGFNPFGAARISPATQAVCLAPGEKKAYVYEVTGDENLSWYAVGKLCVNGRIHFSGVDKHGERHCIWGHILCDDVYRDGASLRKLLEIK